MNNVSAYRAVFVLGCLVLGGLPAQAGNCEPQWSPLGSGVSGPFPSVRSLTVFDDGSGPALYAGGDFTQAGGSPASNIAKWDGSSWSPLGSGLQSAFFGSEARTLTVFDDGSGQSLYAGGSFTQAGGIPVASGIASWDGLSWSPLPSGGVSNGVRELTVFDHGSSPALYVGGDSVDPTRSIVRWDGSSWLPLGSGVSSGGANVLAVFDDGTGPALYAGGGFGQAGGAIVNFIARWDGSSWWPLGSGLNGSATAMTVFDDGSGPALYVGGAFTQAGGIQASGIAKWDGSSWSPLGSGLGNNNVRALTVFDDGTGPALYAGGVFSLAGGVQAFNIARWDGSSWSALGAGMQSGPVSALTVFDDGSGPALYAGGFFTQAGGVPVNYIARWGSPCAAVPCPADVTGDGSVDPDDLNLVLTNFGQSTSNGDTNNDGVVDLADLSAVLNAFGTDCP